MSVRFPPNQYKTTMIQAGIPMKILDQGAFQRTLLVACLMGSFGIMGCELRQDLKAKATATKMRQFGYAIAAKEAGAHDQSVLSLIAEEENGIEDALDSWGRELQIESTSLDNGKPATLLISLGRDGKQGSCCEGYISSDWNADAVLLIRDGKLEWLQAWQ